MSRRYPTFPARPLGRLESIILFGIVYNCSGLSNVSLLKILKRAGARVIEPAAGGLINCSGFWTLKAKESLHYFIDRTRTAPMLF